MWFFKKKKSKEHYMLVYTYKIGVQSQVSGNGVLYIYLYESNFGNRKMENKSDIHHNNNFDAIDFYCSTIYPWLNGKYFEEIPSYWTTYNGNKKNNIKEIYTTYFKE